MSEPRFFVSELWGFLITTGRTSGKAHPQVTATVFDRYYEPWRVVRSFRAGRGRRGGRGMTSAAALERAHGLCAELNTSEPWPEPVPLDPWWEATA